MPSSGGEVGEHEAMKKSNAKKEAKKDTGKKKK